MNQKYKDDIIMILRDIGKDAGVIIAFSTVFLGSISVGGINSSKLQKNH